eukprot:PhF_6_TR31192/c0_g1_i1/m.45744
MNRDDPFTLLAEYYDLCAELCLHKKNSTVKLITERQEAYHMRTMHRREREVEEIIKQKHAAVNKTESAIRVYTRITAEEREKHQLRVKTISKLLKTIGPQIKAQRDVDRIRTKVDMHLPDVELDLVNGEDSLPQWIEALQQRRDEIKQLDERITKATQSFKVIADMVTKEFEDDLLKAFPQGVRDIELLRDNYRSLLAGNTELSHIVRRQGSQSPARHRSPSPVRGRSTSPSMSTIRAVVSPRAFTRTAWVPRAPKPMEDSRVPSKLHYLVDKESTEVAHLRVTLQQINEEVGQMKNEMYETNRNLKRKEDETNRELQRLKAVHITAVSGTKKLLVEQERLQHFVELYDSELFAIQSRLQITASSASRDRTPPT